MKKIDIAKTAFFALNQDGITLGSYLAQMKQDEAVQEFLVHNGPLEEVIYGYALAGNIHQVFSLLAKFPDKATDSIGYAIRGFARAQNLEKINSLLDYKMQMLNVVIGLAQAGNKTQVTAILDRHLELFPAAVEGYACCNHEHLLSNLIKGTSFYPLAIFHAARAGHTLLVNHLLSQCGLDGAYKVAPAFLGKDIEAHALFNHATQGYLAGRHFLEAANMLGRGASTSLSLAALKDERGLPSYELYMAFLAHISDKNLRLEVLKNIHTKSLMDLFQKNLSEQLERIIDCMENHHLNYVEARDTLENKASSVVIKGDIGLPYLAELIIPSPELSSQLTPN
jgi:hypothetical protein